MIASKLTLNISKPNVIVINSNSKNNNLTTDVLTSKLSLVQNARVHSILKVSFGICLSLNDHNTLLENLSRAVGILAKAKSFLNRKALFSFIVQFFTHIYTRD